MHACIAIASLINMQQQCVICCDEAGDHVVTCPSCRFEACASCTQRFLVNTLDEPSCMSCRRVWARDFVMGHDAFAKKWVNGVFFEHMGHMIMEQEKALLPGDQQTAAGVKNVRELQAQVKELPTQKKLDRIRDAEKKQHAELEKRIKRDQLMSAIAALKKGNPFYSASELSAVEAKQPRDHTTYIMPCPGCRGFISDKYQCGTCSLEVCKKCHLEKKPGHTCKKEDVESATAIKNNTKPCPKCKTAIFKISGCNQMFCTACHTSFEWDTLTIVAAGSVIHNPHYFEWLAGQAGGAPINIEEIACGEIPNAVDFATIITANRMLPKTTRNMFEVYRNIGHIRALLPHFAVDLVKDNFDLRIQYLLGDFDQTEWATKLKNREKKRMKIKACRDLLELYVTIISDFVRQFIAAKAETQVTAILLQYRQLIKYHDTAVDRIIRVHGGKIPHKMETHFLF